MPDNWKDVFRDEYQAARQEHQAANPKKGRKRAVDDDETRGIPEFSEDAIALEFTQEHGDALRYVVQWGKWLQWSSTRWRPDTLMKTFNRARLICRRVAERIKLQDKDRARVASAKTAAAVVKFAAADPRHASEVHQWDADPWLFLSEERENDAAKAVAIELRTGTARPPRRDDYCTKAGKGLPTHGCPLWLAFLDRVTAGDEDLQSYLQRVAGYCLTGDTSEEALFFLYGTGANGKSVCVNTLIGIWGDYSAIAPMELLMASENDRHPTELAKLQGARLVVATETESGRQWAESKIKALTGRDKITARFMRQDFFDYIPQFKLMIAGNHKPGLTGVDVAIRRRIHLAPFNVTIPPEDRDHDLPNKLKAERGGILQWAVDRCLEWQRTGLAPPQVVQDATEEYLNDEDIVQRWIDERCIIAKNRWEVGERLWSSWKAWADRNNERVGTRKGFSKGMKARGFPPEKSQHVRGHKGISLRGEDYL